LDEESVAWLRRLAAEDGERQAAERELHVRLVRIALAEVRRRSASTPVTGPELDDVAYQAAGDAMLAILARVHLRRQRQPPAQRADRYRVRAGQHRRNNPGKRHAGAGLGRSLLREVAFGIVTAGRIGALHLDKPLRLVNPNG
jgi:hypothetical protein